MRFESMRFLPGGIGMRAFLGLRCGILVHMITASVILDIPTQSLDTPYTYVVPRSYGRCRGGVRRARLLRQSQGRRLHRRDRRGRSAFGRWGGFHARESARRRLGDGEGKVACSIGSRGALDSFVASTEVAGVPTAASGYQGAQPGDGAQMPLQTHFGFGAQYEAASPETGFAREHASNIKIKPIERVLSKP